MSSESHSSSSPINFGSGLVEIAAVTTIIGATTAESLVLGSRGAPGLPWAAMSSFGALHIVKSSLTACTPASLRDSLGLRTVECDQILGMRTVPRALNAREPVGMISRPSTKRHVTGKTLREKEIEFIYKFDDYTNSIICSCPATRKDKPSYIFGVSIGEPQRAKGTKQNVFDWLGIIVSLVKASEFVILVLQDGFLLAVSSCATWLFFFLAAIVLQALGLSREYSAPESDKCVDILAGSLPTIQNLGSKLQIVLGAPMNVRMHAAWRVVWFVGCLVSCVSLFSTCIILSNQTLEVFYTWAIFQVFWLLLRTVFYHYAFKTDDIQHVTLRWVPPYPGSRLLCLATGVSQYQAMRHPRGVSSYAKDEQDATKIEEQIRTSTWFPALQRENIDSYNSLDRGPRFGNIHTFNTVEVECVIGDTVLSAFAWVHNLGLDDMDMYDSCLVAFKLHDKRYLVPSARVMSGNIAQARAACPDPEAHVANNPGLVPRLGPNDTGNNGWVFWVPLRPDRWLNIICNMDFLGAQLGEILDDAEVTRRLKLGTLGVSLAQVDEIRDIVQKSATVGQVIVKSVIV